MVFNNLLDPVFGPLLNLEPVLSIFIIALILTIITTLAYKYLTDQKKIKQLRAEMKAFQEKIKKLSKTDPDKAMKEQQKMMGMNTELMKHSFKPTLYTFLPLIIIFGWLNAHMAYESLGPQVPFSVQVELDSLASGPVELSITPSEGMALSKDDTLSKELVGGKAEWVLKGNEGLYQLKFTYDSVSVTKDIEITTENNVYSQPEEKFGRDQAPFKKVIIGNEKIHPLTGVPLIGGFGWLATYIMFSVALSFGLRRLMKIS